MVVKSNKSNLYHYFISFCILFFPYWSSFRKIYISSAIFIVVSYLPAVLIIIKKHGLRIHFEWLDFFMFYSIIFILYNNWNFKVGSYFIEIIHISIFIFYFLYRDDLNYIKPILNLMLFYAIFYGIFTILFFIFKDFYVSKIIPIFDIDTQATLIMIYNQGGVSGLTTHYSLNAIYLSIGVLVAFSKYISTGKKKNLILMCLIFICLLITGKRGHSLFVFLSLLISYLIIKRNKFLNSFKILFVTAISIFSIVILSSYIPGIGNVLNRINEQSQTGDISSGRYVFWTLALSMFPQHPIIGVGWDGFKYYYLSQTGIIINVHNVYIQLLYETGVVGFTVFMVIFNAFLLRIIKCANYKNQNTQINICYLLYSLGIQLFFLLYCFTGNSLYDAQVFLPYIIGGMISYNYFKNRRKETRKLI